MITTMRVRTNLEPGARLLFEPDLEREEDIAEHKQVWDEYDDHRHEHFKFCRDNYGRAATLVRFVLETVSILDPKQRPSGVYHTSKIEFTFDGETEVRVGYDRDFVVLGQVAVVDAPVPVKIADLPEEVQFYPDDVVMVTYADSSEDSSEALYEKVAYSHRMGECSVELVHRGNIYWLYHDPNKMTFASPAAELQFWWGEQNAIDPHHELFAKRLNGRLMTKNPRQGIAACKPRIESGEVDFVVHRQVTGHSSSLPTWEVWKLQDTFAAARPRVRALSEQFYLEASPTGVGFECSCVKW
jgi:hypothetical protein